MEQKELMQGVKDYWQEHNIFQKSLDQRSDTFQIATYDGPPFASGSPHFGHGLVGAMKDAFLRYKTMKGYKVNRDRGWDCHGLPVEKAVEKALGLDGKKDIEEKLGVEKFTEACRAYVGKTDQEWRIFVDSIGRRADMDHAYYTMNLDFMESIIRVFQNMYNQNLVYKGFKVQRCCPSCATSLSNSEVNEGYKDRQDPAITIKFKVTNDQFDKSKYESTDDNFVHVVDCVIKKEKKILMQYHKRGQCYVFPGGKVDAGEDILYTVKRELKEEHDLDVVSIKELGNFKKIIKGRLHCMHMVEVEVTGEAKNLEPEKHPQMIRAEIIPSDNSLGFAVKIDGTIVDDDFEIMNQFYDLYAYHHQIAQQISDEKTDVNILAWTTTPRTLPSNMFLAVGKHIHYYMVFDKSAKEYYILAEALIKQYYKNPDEYILINILKGEDLVGITYEPLFPFINQSKIDQKYKDQFFKIIPAEFVSTEDGTGIVHMAPGFGIEDFDAVAQFLPRDDSKDWLFMPVNEYGEFTDDVPDWNGQSVFEVNKEVITRLKNEKKLIGQKSYSHSYPHCWRCETPLISRALTSRFIKEPELTSITVPNAEKIGFVPESVKNRFIDTLKSAPDWNLSRNRYRGSPLPIREKVESPKSIKSLKSKTGGPDDLMTLQTDDRIVIGKLDELYERSKTGSKNLTKLMFLRHANSNYNFHHLEDSRGNAVLSEEGRAQAINLVTDLQDTLDDLNDVVFILSPLQIDFLTIQPYFEKIFDTATAKKIRDNYYDVVEKYHKLFDEKKLYDYIISSGDKNRFEIGKNIYVDFRTMELFLPDYQDKEYDGLSILWNTTKHGPNGESVEELYQRTEGYLLDTTKI
ncbi:MAG: class I tRNA ligase family protein, partial [candidate division SR1 bacterium]|nr:class I tRNA ligase family protein [candidate division SR1 bacterium]